MNFRVLVFLVEISGIFVTPLWAQFNTIKILPTPIEINTSDVYPNKLVPQIDVFPREESNDSVHSLSIEIPMLSQPFIGKKIINSPFGYRHDPFTNKRKFHAGVDYATSSQNIFAMMPGKIKDIDYNKKLGNYVVLEHGDFTVTYGHLFTVQGHKGDDVYAGKSIGISGSTGRSTGEHLHISIKYKGKLVDPEPIVNYIEMFVTEVIKKKR